MRTAGIGSAQSLSPQQRNLELGSGFVGVSAPQGPAASTRPCLLCTSCTCSLPDCARRCPPLRNTSIQTLSDCAGKCPPHRTPCTGTAVPYPVVLADATPSALPARAPYPIVLADAPPSALPAPVSYPLVLADAAPFTLPAKAPLPIVLADARPSALLALSVSPIVLADAHPSAHSRHRLLLRLYSHCPGLPPVLPSLPHRPPPHLCLAAY